MFRVLFTMLVTMQYLLALTSSSNTFLHFGLLDNTTSVQLKQGDTLTLGFYSLLSTGYSWTIHEEDKDIRALNFTSFIRQEIPPNNFMWNATAIVAGETDHLKFTCGTPWGGVAQTVVLTVDVLH